jgi:hypothetical protein
MALYTGYFDESGNEMGNMFVFGAFDKAIGHPYSFCARFSTVQVTHWSKANQIINRN